MEHIDNERIGGPRRKKKGEPVGIYDLLGLAIGCIGMSHDDFCKSTFGEFESIYKAWREMTEGQAQDAWERARTVATIAIQPHVKKETYPSAIITDAVG